MLGYATIGTKDMDRAVAFYRDVLGFDVARTWADGAYLAAGPLWLCLSRDPQARARPHPDYTHAALDVSEEDFEPLCQRIRASGATIWKDNRSEEETNISICRSD